MSEQGQICMAVFRSEIATSHAFKVAQRSRKGGSALQSPTCFWSAFGVVLTDFDDLRVCEAVAAGDRAARTLLFDTLDK